jgi:hypothetical protein
MILADIHGFRQRAAKGRRDTKLRLHLGVAISGPSPNVTISERYPSVTMTIPVIASTEAITFRIVKGSLRKIDARMRM